MRLELQMELLKPEIDIDYRRIIISYLKFALEHCEGGRFFEKFYKNLTAADILLMPKRDYRKLSNGY